jgi:hypothetical protein
MIDGSHPKLKTKSALTFESQTFFSHQGVSVYATLLQWVLLFIIHLSATYNWIP